MTVPSLQILDPSGNPSTVNPGDIVESSWGNAVHQRTIKRFADAAARDVAIPAPVNGMCCYVDTPWPQIQMWNLAQNQWIPIAGTMPAVYIEWGAPAGTTPPGGIWTPFVHAPASPPIGTGAPFTFGANGSFAAPYRGVWNVSLQVRWQPVGPDELLQQTVWLNGVQAWWPTGYRSAPPITDITLAHAVGLPAGTTLIPAVASWTNPVQVTGARLAMTFIGMIP